MDPLRFDGLARMVGASTPRRAILAAAGGLLAGLPDPFARPASAGCKKIGKKCGKKKCCGGAKCRHGKCRCKKGWAECNGDGLCRDLSSDPDNCSACGQACATGCCAGGACVAPCGDACCAECFGEAPGEKGPIIKDTEFCCAASSICTRGTADPADDLCCWPDEACIDGECCCNGCEGTVVCGGACCPSVSCCNGKCCGADEVCARPQKNKPRKCVSGNRSCASSGDCFDGETCHGGICCSGDRVCFAPNQPNVAVCCPVGEHCDASNQSCCPNGIDCGTTAKKVRIRA